MAVRVLYCFGGYSIQVLTCCSVEQPIDEVRINDDFDVRARCSTGQRL